MFQSLFSRRVSRSARSKPSRPVLFLTLSLTFFAFSPLVPRQITQLVRADDEKAQQGEVGVVKLQVLDSKDKPLPNAVVTLIPKKLVNEDGRTTAPVQRLTNQAGELSLAQVAPGKYDLQIEADGHETFIEKEFDVQAGTVTNLSIQLMEKLAASSETIEVKAESDALIEQTSAPQGTVTAQVIRTSPLLTKTFDAAIPNVPNVIRATDGKISIKGGREDQSALLVNEADSTDPATGNFSLSIPLESIDQVKVFTNPYLPEYGKFTGGVTKVETKRGGDKWKFEAFDFFPEPRIRGGKIFGFANVSPRVHFEGPIIKDKFFWSQGLEYLVDKKPVRGLPSPDNETIRDFARSFTQFDYFVSPNQTLTATINFSNGIHRHFGLDFFNPQPVSPDRRMRDVSISVIDRLTLSNDSLLETLFQYKRLDTRTAGKGILPMIVTPTVREGNFFNRQERDTERYEARVTDTWAPINAKGIHRVKIGSTLTYSRNDGYVRNQSVTIARADGTAAQRIDYLNEGDLDTWNAELAGFAQDQWMIRPNLNLEYGFRAEAVRAAAGINISPRAAVSYSPTKSGNTVLRAGVGLFYDKIPLNALTFTALPRQRVTTFAADGTTEIDGPRTFFNVLSPRPNGKPNTGFEFAAPRNLTYNLQLDQRINGKTLLKVAFLESKTDNDLYISPTTSNGKDSIMLFNDGRGRYRSLEVTGNFKISEGREFTVSYIRSRARGELNNFNTYYGDIPDPVIRPNQYSQLTSDAPNRLLVQGRFKLPLGLSVAPLFDLHTGFPYSIRDENQDFIGTRNADATRFPRFASLDVAVTKDIKLFDHKAQITVTVFNATNHFNPRNVFNNVNGQEFGTFFANYRRFFRLDFAFDF